MALNENVKNLIKCVADNDLLKAKQYIKAIIENEKSEKNKSFCGMINNKLQVPSANMMELPVDLKSLLKMEDVSVSFNENRYYLTEREEKVFNETQSAVMVNSKLSEMGIRHINSTLLYGESGTGKTTFGRYVAYKLGIPFAYLNFAHCISSYLGETAKNIEKVFDYIKKSKCVFMLDEIDAIALKRGRGDVSEMSRVVIGLMQALDLLENGIIVIGATNRIDNIDDALKRRFAIKHEVKPLEQWETRELIKMILDDLQISYSKLDTEIYAIEHNKQSEIMNDITRSIIRMLKSGTSTEIKLTEVRND